MQKETISDRQGISLMIMFIIGTSTIFVTGLEAKKDLWLTVILAAAAALPIILVYVRLHNNFPEKNLFDMIEICFGKFIGKGINIVYTWFVFHTGTLVFMNWGQFAGETDLIDTPLISIYLGFILPCIWIVKEGIEVMGRWVNVFLPVLSALIFVASLLLIPSMNIDHIRPVLHHGIRPVIQGVLPVLIFPFTQTVVFGMAFSSFKRRKSSYKIYIVGLLIGGLIILSTSLLNLLVLGVETAETTYYPAHESVSRIRIGDFLQRVDVIVAIGFTLGAFIKTSIYLLAACKGVSKIFGHQNYRFIVMPVGLLMLNLSYFAHHSLMEYFKWILEVFYYYAFPFQILLPLIILIAAEIRKKREI